MPNWPGWIRVTLAWPGWIREFLAPLLTNNFDVQNKQLVPSMQVLLIVFPIESMNSHWPSVVQCHG